jgi:mRNA interferase RelE/StbE
MTFEVRVAPSAAKALARINKKDRLRVAGAIELLAIDPRPPGAKMLRGGEQGRWRVRTGDYRVVYAIADEGLIVLILRVAHRREVYD